MVPMSTPHPYELPVMNLLTSHPIQTEAGQASNLREIYVYWFVAEGRLTARHAQRMWWMARDLVEKRVLQRWGYVTVFSVCVPGDEEKTFAQMKEFISRSVPEFQLAAGPESTARPRPLAAAIP